MTQCARVLPGGAENVARQTMARQAKRKLAPALSLVPRAVATEVRGEEATSSNLTLSMLLADLRTRFSFPALAATSAEEFSSVVVDKFDVFRETMDAMKALRRVAGKETGASDLSFMLQYQGRLAELGGEEAADELAFAISTLDRASALAMRLEPAGVELDAQGASDFDFYSTFCAAGLVLLLEICAGAPHTSVAFEQVFEITRAGALRAYVAVRTAWDESCDDDDDDAGGPTGDFDGEDSYLAGLSS